MTPKITGYEVRKDGVWLVFDVPFALNGSLRSRDWFVSWEKLGEILVNHGCSKLPEKAVG